MAQRSRWSNFEDVTVHLTKEDIEDFPKCIKERAKRLGGYKKRSSPL